MVEGGKRERREPMQKYSTIPLSEEPVIDDCSIKMFYLIQSCTATLPKQFSFLTLLSPLSRKVVSPHAF